MEDSHSHPVSPGQRHAHAVFGTSVHRSPPRRIARSLCELATRGRMLSWSEDTIRVEGEGRGEGGVRNLSVKRGEVQTESRSRDARSASSRPVCRSQDAPNTCSRRPRRSRDAGGSSSRRPRRSRDAGGSSSRPVCRSRDARRASSRPLRRSREGRDRRSQPLRRSEDARAAFDAAA